MWEKRGHVCEHEVAYAPLHIHTHKVTGTGVRGKWVSEDKEMAWHGDILVNVVTSWTQV